MLPQKPGWRAFAWPVAACPLTRPRPSNGISSPRPAAAAIPTSTSSLQNKARRCATRRTRQRRNGCRRWARGGLDGRHLHGQTAGAMQHSALLNVMIAAARKAARAIKRDFGELEKLQVSLKSPANFVTAADRRAEETIYAELMKARPGYGFLGEESGRRDGTDQSHMWVVDPLDGTTNFLHGIPHFAISIALERDGAVVAGLIYNPATDEMFLAEKGKGAFLNDHRIRVAARTRLAEAIVACGIAHHGHGDVGLSRKEVGAIQEHVAEIGRAHV